MTAPARQPASIVVMAGRFASQQLAFAHLLDVADRIEATLDLDAVDVMQGTAVGRRLAHYFDAATVAAVLSAGDGCDTCVLFTDPDAFLPPIPPICAASAFRRPPRPCRARSDMLTAGPRNLITDVPGILVGNAEDARLKSGVTVLTSRPRRSPRRSTSWAARPARARPTFWRPTTRWSGSMRWFCRAGRPSGSMPPPA